MRSGYLICVYLLTIGINSLAAEDAVLTLESCLEIALDTSPLTRAAQEGVKLAAADICKLQEAGLPNVEAVARYHRFQTHAFLPFSPLFNDVPTFIGPTNDWQFGLCGSYLLYDGGLGRAQLSAAMALQSQACEEAQKTYQKVILEVSAAFYTLAAQLELHDVAQLLSERSEEHLRLAEQRKEVGAVSRADLLRIEVEAAEARQALAKAEGDVRIAIGNLNIAMGLPPETPLKIKPERHPAVAPKEDELADALTTAIEYRPELLAARDYLKALAAQVNAERAVYKPRLTADGLVGYRDIMFPPRDKDWSIGVSIEWPLLAQFSSQSNVHQAQSRWSRAQAEYAQLMLQVKQQVWQAFSQLKTAYENIQAAEARLQNAQESIGLIEQRYRVDAATTSDLLDAQTSLARAEAFFVEAHWMYATNETLFLWAQGLLYCDTERVSKNDSK